MDWPLQPPILILLANLKQLLEHLPIKNIGKGI